MKDWESFLSIEVCERIERMNSVQTPVSMGMQMLSISKDGEVRFSMDSDDKLNAVGFAHGGAIFALADQAFAIATNLGEELQVAISANISYIKPGKGILEAVARKVADTRRTSIVEVRVYGNGDLIAIFQGTGYKLGMKSAPVNGDDDSNGSK